MPKIAIVTDSTSDLPAELISKYNINVIPLILYFGQEEFMDDGKSLTIEDFFIKLKDSDVFPTTSQPSTGEYIKLYRKLLKTHNSIISIHISNKLSGAINSALLAKKYFSGKDITIIDSLAAHAPLGLIVLKAAQMSNDNIPKEEIVAKVYEMIKKVKAFILPKNLENLKRGGRIGKAMGTVASLLDIKPILTLTPDGHIGIYKAVRGWNKAKRIAVKSMGNFISGNKNLIVALSDANATEDVEEVEEEIRAFYNPKEIMKLKIGIIIGTHVGTGIGITFYEE